MSAETPGIASDKKQNVEAPTSKTPLATPITTIPPFEKGGLGGIPRGPGGIIPKEPEWIHHLDIWATAETEKKSGRGRSGGNGSSVYGIQKLRELILELAVRGKLVPQDPNDEPAGELLRRIQVEKAKLVAEGKIKKDRPLPPISDEEKPFELPQGWEWVRFGEACSYIQRGKGPAYVDNSEFLVISQKCVRWTGLDLTQARFIDPESVSKYETIRLLCEGDVLWNSTGTGTIGRACLVPPLLDQQFLVADSHVTVVRPIGLWSVFLCRWIQSPSVQSQIEGVASGTTNQIELNTSTVISHPLPLPPLAEQHRIVAKVDELMAICDQLETQHINAAEAHEKLVSHLLGTLTQSQNADDFSANWQRIAAHFDTLFTTEASIDALKQTLLQLAVMGRLVPQDPNDEPAIELLKRIQVEKAKLMTEGKIKKSKSPLTPLLPRGETGSVAATSINPTTTTLSTPPLSNSIPNPTPPFEKGGVGGIQRGISEEEKPFELPQGWEWTTLASISLINPRNNAEDNSSASFVPMTMIGTKFNSSHDQEIRLWKEIKQGFTHFSENDIGVAKITPCFENSKACVFSGLLNGIGAGTTELHIVRPVNETLAPRYVLAYLKSPQFLLIGETRMTGTAGQKRLPKEFVESNPFPLPPLSEQHRIVAKIDELMTLCDQLKSAITQASQLQKKLADVVVEQAIAS